VICPVCGIKGKLQETRRLEETMRRYHCGAGHKWKTLEKLEMVYDSKYVANMRAENGRRMAAAKLDMGNQL
jgi:hypothetical protein